MPAVINYDMEMGGNVAEYNKTASNSKKRKKLMHGGHSAPNLKSIYVKTKYKEDEPEFPREKSYWKDKFEKYTCKMYKALMKNEQALSKLNEVLLVKF